MINSWHILLTSMLAGYSCLSDRTDISRCETRDLHSTRLPRSHRYHAKSRITHENSRACFGPFFGPLNVRSYTTFTFLRSTCTDAFPALSAIVDLKSARLQRINPRICFRADKSRHGPCVYTCYVFFTCSAHRDFS